MRVLLPSVFILHAFLNIPSANALDSLVFNQSAPVHIDALHGITCEEDQKKCTANNGVRVHQDGLFLNANKLTTFFSEKNKDPELSKVVAEGHVVVQTKENHRLECDRLTIHLDNQSLEAEGANINVAYADMLLTCHDKIQYLLNQHRLKATGDVIVKDRDYLLKSNEVIATFVKNAEGKTHVSKLTVPKDCVLSTPREYIEADQGDYDTIQNTVTLKGNVRITRESGQLRGDVVEVDLASGNSFVKSQKSRVELLIIPQKRETFSR